MNMNLNPNEVLQEVQNINPMAVELAMERVARKALEQELRELRHDVSTPVGDGGR